MGEQLLLLRLEGPLQSWGLSARWDVRDSGREPTKSGVVGLIGAALGYSRDEERLVSELESGLEMGIRVEREGAPLDDYHTVTGFLPMAEGGFKHGGGRVKALASLVNDPLAEPSTIVSTRRYLMDASFLVVLRESITPWSGILDRCASALKDPAWTLYLGRRACVPTRPVFEALTDHYSDIEDALRRHPWSVLGRGATSRDKNSDERLRIIVEDINGSARDDRRTRTAGRVYGRRFVRDERIDFPGENLAVQ